MFLQDRIEPELGRSASAPSCSTSRGWVALDAIFAGADSTVVGVALAVDGGERNAAVAIGGTVAFVAHMTSAALGTRWGNHCRIAKHEWMRATAHGRSSSETLRRTPDSTR